MDAPHRADGYARDRTDSELKTLLDDLALSAGIAARGSRTAALIASYSAAVDAENARRGRPVTSDSDDHYCVRQLTDTELPRIRAQLAARLEALTVGAPERVPIAAHMRAIDGEIGRRALARRQVTK